MQSIVSHLLTLIGLIVAAYEIGALTVWCVLLVSPAVCIAPCCTFVGQEREFRRARKQTQTHASSSDWSRPEAHTHLETDCYVSSFSQGNKPTGKDRDSFTLSAHPQHVWIELLERELGHKGDQVVLTQQQPAALWIFILHKEDRKPLKLEVNSLDTSQ